MSELLPPCINACPVQTDVRGYLAAIARRDYVEAYRLIRANNPFPSVCAWVCPHPCEDVCRRATVDAPVSIRNLKRFVVETVGRTRWEVPRCSDTGKKVAVVGAGPAGLTAAYDLVRLGHRVVVYDRQRFPGGHFLASLPIYRLPREVLRRDVEDILAAGVKVCNGVEVGRDITISQLMKEHDAVIVGTGLWVSRGLALPGFDRPGVYLALPFLKKANLGKKPEDIGDRVIVIGGGDVAMDVARTAVRLGASEVRVACLEPREQIPAHPWEVEEAVVEGVTLLPGCGPVEILADGVRITGLKVQKVKSVFDGEGNFNPVYEPGSFETIPGDTIILAIGQLPDNSFLKGSGLKIAAEGFLTTNGQSQAAGDCGVFACGEIACGPGPAIAAVASGHRVAAAAARYLKGEKAALSDVASDKKETEVIGQLPVGVTEKVPRRGRCSMPVLPPHERVNNYLPYELGLDEKTAFYEASRCLSCGLGAQVNEEKCAACLTCRRVCPYDVPVVKEHAGIAVEGCQACGTCAAACPAGAITVGTIDEERLLSLLDSPAIKDNIVVFACKGAYVNFQRQVCLVQIPTAGALRLEWILKAFESEALGVAVVACGDDRCRHVDGTAIMEGVVARARGLLERIGIPPDRLYYCRPGEVEVPITF